MRFARLLAIFALSACMPTIGSDVSRNRPNEVTTVASTSGMRSLAAPSARAPTKSNQEILGNFFDLEFRMESGRPLPVFTRFEGPITVSLNGAVPVTANTDLSRLIGRFRNEAGLNISQVNGAASINVEFLPRRQIQAAFSNVACFVAPRVASWQEYRQARGTGLLDWTTITRRERVAIFVPSDSSPQ